MEAPLAGPLSPLVLAVGAAAVTGIIVVGVIAGPGTLNCVQRGDFPICMNETFFDGAVVPGDEPATEQAAATQESEDADASEIAVADDAAEPADAPVVEAEPEAPAEDVEAEQPVEAPETDSTDAPTQVADGDEPEQPAEPIAQDVAPDTEAEPEASIADATDLPSLDVVRVEPDGSAVIAGSATPSGEIVLYADDQEIGSETAGVAGDWVFVTDEPLPSGGVELRVLDVETQDFAESSIIVVVQDDREGEPLVIASAPGQASEILQGLQSAEPLVVADAESDADAINDQGETAELESQPSETTIAIAQTEVPGDDDAATPDETEATGSPIETAAADQADDAAGLTSETAAESDSPALQPDLTAPAETATEAPSADMPTTVASVPDAAEPAALPATAPTIDAVEIDGDRNFFAGAGEDGMTVRLYVENRLVGSTEVADGRWLVEAINVLTGAAQRVRIDMLDAAGNVVGRSEVNFVMDVPDTVDEAPIVVAEEAGSGSQSPTTDEPAVEPGAPTPSIPLAEPQPETPTTPSPVDTPEPEAANVGTPVPDVTSESEGAEAAEPVAAASASEADTSTPALGQPDAPDAAPSQPIAPDAASETPSEDDATPAAPGATDQTDIPTLVGVTEDGRTTSGLAIIRQGDNLWTIARRVYGAGMRYTQIFEANTDQIRDPDLIYPGQVFDLPGTNTVVGEDEAAEG